ncbi:MAG: hypothetical protein QW735_00880 [archaeon]
MRDKLIAILFFGILFFSTLEPISFAISKEINITSMYKIKNVQNCEKEVEIVTLNASEYERLLNNSITIDFYGNTEAQKRADTYNKAGVSPDSSVNNVKDLFILGPGGKPILLFDTLQHKIVPAGSQCYLTDAFYRGAISFAGKIDWNTRICSEIHDPACENGYLSEAQKETNAQNYGKIQALLNAIEKNSEQDLERAWSESGWKEQYKEIYEESMNAIKGGEKDKAAMAIMDLSTKIMDIQQTGRMNIIESNRTTGLLSQMDFGFLIPKTLLAYTHFLAGKAGLEEYAEIAGWVSTAVGFASLKGGMKKGTTVTKSGIAAQAKKYMEISEKVKGLKELEGSGKLGRIGKWRLSRLEKEMTSLEEELKNNDKLMEKAFVEYSGIKTLTEKELGLSEKELQELIKEGKMPKDMKNAIENGLVGEYEKEFCVKEGCLDKIQGYISELKNSEGGLVKDPRLKFVRKIIEQPSDEEIKLIAEGRSKISIGKKTIDLSRYLEVEKGTKKGIIIKAEEGLYRAGVTFLINGGRYVLNALTLAHAQALMHRAAMLLVGAWALTQEPKGEILVHALEFELTPTRKLINQSSYLDIVVTKLKYAAEDGIEGEDFRPPSAWIKSTNLVFGIEWKDIPLIAQKVQSGKQSYVFIADQEQGLTTALTSARPLNVFGITEASPGKIMFATVGNPLETAYYLYEHPSSLFYFGKTFVSSIGMDITNVNMSGWAPSTEDWAQLPASKVAAQMPNWGDVGKSILLTSFIVPLPTFGGITPASRALVAIAIAAGLQQQGRVMQEISEHMKEVRWAPISDPLAAYASGEDCEKTLVDVEGKVDEKFGWYYAAIIADLAATSVDTVATYSGVGAIVKPATTIASIATSLWSYEAQRQYEEAKAEGLERLKRCKETKFSLLAFQQVDRGELKEEADDLTAQLSSQLKPAVQSLGTLLQGFAPEAANKISEIVSASTYTQILNIQGKINPPNNMNYFMPEIYQFHFDPDTIFDFNTGEDCPIQFCQQVEEGKFKCIEGKGYYLYDEKGNLILEGPELLGLRWHNDRGYLGLPLQVINVFMKDDTLFKIRSDDTVTIENDCVKNAILKLFGGVNAKEAYKEKIIKNAFGGFQFINTKEGYIWKEKDGFYVRFLKESKCGEEVHGLGKVLSVGQEITVYRNGSIQAGSCLFTMDSRSYIEFENEKTVIGRAKEESKTYGRNVMHLFFYDLYVDESTNFENWRITDPCETDGLKGFKLVAETRDPDERAQLQALLEEMCFDRIVSLDKNESIYIKDNQLCWNKEGKEECHDIKEIKDGVIKFDDGMELKVKTGPNGEPVVEISKDGKPVSSFPVWLFGSPQGSIIFNAESGKISISNEFPLNLNPSFQTLGGGWAGGGIIPMQNFLGTSRVAGGGPTKPSEKPSILAQLPSVPEGIEFLPFLIAVILGILIIRKRFSAQNLQS